MTATLQDAAHLHQQFNALRNSQPSVRTRDAARALKVSEAELLALRCGEDVSRLHGPWPDLVAAAAQLGPCMGLTRNEHAVLERSGTYGALERNAHVGTVLGPDIDLRIFFHRWALGFAAEEDFRGTPRRSLQFFDEHGTAIHKIFLKDAAQGDAFLRLVRANLHPDQTRAQLVTTELPREADRADGEIDVDGLRRGWAALQDTHAFFPLLRTFKVGRMQALRLAGAPWARRVPANSFREMLKTVALETMPIMVFVGNPGMIQIHTGPVKKLLATGEWFNVMDPSFNLHVVETAIAHAFVVHKPTSDGPVTSLELFDADAQNILLMFGARKPGVPELPGWRAHLHALPDLPPG